MAVMEPQYSDQHQIGDEVVYVPEGVITTVTGYDWIQGVDAPPKIIAYQLACGISAPKSLLAAYVGDRRYATGGMIHVGIDRRPPPDLQRQIATSVREAMRASSPTPMRGDGPGHVRSR